MPDTNNTAGSPTVVLVHGAFADASSWNGVIERLQEKGVQVTAPANPLRGISIDSAYIASVFEETPGPVVAVGMVSQPQTVTDVILEAVAASASGRPTATVGGADAREA